MGGPVSIFLPDILWHKNQRSWVENRWPKSGYIQIRCSCCSIVLTTVSVGCQNTIVGTVDSAIGAVQRGWRNLKENNRCTASFSLLSSSDDMLSNFSSGLVSSFFGCRWPLMMELMLKHAGRRVRQHLTKGRAFFRCWECTLHICRSQSNFKNE